MRPHDLASNNDIWSKVMAEQEQSVLDRYEKFDGVGLHAETIRTRASIGEAYLDCYESALSDPLLAGYTPADCPSELLLDLLERLREATPTPDAVNADKALIDALRDVVGDEIGNKIEARERFGEESIELIQAAGGSLAEVIWLAQQVFAKPVDPVALEVGQVNTALHRLAFAHDVDVATEAERDRVHIAANADAIRERHARKERFFDKALMPEAAVGLIKRLRARMVPNPFRQGDRLLPPVIDPLCAEAATFIERLATPTPVEEPEKGATGQLDAVTLAVCKKLHGDDFDPFANPETYEFGQEIARAALAATNARQVEASQTVSQDSAVEAVARALAWQDMSSAKKRGVSRDEPLHWKLLEDDARAAIEALAVWRQCNGEK